MQPSQATLIAAAIAALASLITLVVTVMNKRGEEFRTAHRNVIAPDLKDIGRAIHEVVALTNIQLKRLQEPQHAEKYRIAADAAKRLKDLRMSVRYTLWGIDEGLRLLARLPDWVGHGKADAAAAADMFAIGKALGAQLDLAIRTSYAAGSPPGWWRRHRVNRHARRLKQRYELFSASRS